MSEVIKVLSERTGRLICASTGGIQVNRDDYVILDSDLGGDLALVIDAGSKMCHNSKNENKIPKVVRIADEEDIKKFGWLKDKEKKAFQFCLEKINERRLPMKLVRVNYFFNEKKGIFFYTADGRIDFRQLVKDLAKEFKMRIEMRQIGVRDEAKMIGGLGVCGRSLCCFSFMKNFEPVTIQKAKKQQIVINPTKISGLCGRLMCCLAFEDESRGRMYADNDEKVEE